MFHICTENAEYTSGKGYNRCSSWTCCSAGHVNDEIQITVPPLTHQPKVGEVLSAQACVDVQICILKYCTLIYCVRDSGSDLSLL